MLDLWPEHLCVQFGVLRGGNHDALCAADGFQFTQCQVAVFERDQAVAQATVDHVIEILESKTIALAALGLMHVEQDEFIGVLIEEKVQGLDQVADRAAGRGAVECLELINVRVSGVGENSQVQGPRTAIQLLDIGAVLAHGVAGQHAVDDVLTGGIQIHSRVVSSWPNQLVKGQTVHARGLAHPFMPE